MTVSIPLCCWSRATVTSHRAPRSGNPRRSRRSTASAPGRKCVGSVPGWITRSRWPCPSSPRSPRTARARSRVQLLIATSTAAPPKIARAMRRLIAECRILCCSLSRSAPYKKRLYGTRNRSYTQRAGYPAGFTLPQWTNRTLCWRARLVARRDQKSTPGSALVRRTPIGSRSMIAGSPASTSAASGSLGVDTIKSPLGKRRASSPCRRAIPPPIGGKSCANNMVVIAGVPGEACAWACRMLTESLRSEQSASGSAELPVDADQVSRDPVPVVVRLHGRPPGGAHTSTEPLVAEQPDGRGGERGRIVGLHEKPGLAIAYRFRNPTGAAADHGQPARRCLDDGYPESLHEQIVAARGQHEQVGGVVERRKLIVGNEAQQAHGVTQTELGDEALEGVAPASDPCDGVAHRREDGADRRERADHGVDPLVVVEPGHREEPRAAFQTVLAPYRCGIEVGAEAGRRYAQGDHADIGGERAASQELEHRTRQVRGPAAVRHDHGAPREDVARAPTLERRAANLRVEQQKIGPMRDDTERRTAPSVQPGGRVAGGLDLVAPDEPGSAPPRERRGPPGPEAQPVQRAQALGADRHPVDGLGEPRIARFPTRPRPGGNRQPPGRIAQRDLTHHPGDAATEGWEIQGQNERAAQRARVRSSSSDRRRSTASRYTASVRSAERSSVNSRRTSSRPRRAIRAANSASSNTRASDRDQAPGSSGGTSRPVSSGVIRSGLPPASDATTGRPSAIVSRRAIESPSMRDGRADTRAR